MSILRRFAAWWRSLDESDEDKRLRAGMTWNEWYVEVQRPRSMRKHGCATVEEYDALLNSWGRKFNREWDEDQKRREARRRELWPKDKPYRSG